ncbi:MAG: phenylalanine--tRNA ligase beta subunit-related protein [Thermodesulfobacteriota bacterium]
MTEVRVHPDIFRDFPSFRRGIVVAAEIQNHARSERLEAMLARLVEEKSSRPVDLKTDPRILAWHEAHRRFGSNPNKFPPAHAALLKRIQRPGTQIPFISCVVAIMNYHSIASVMPVGGDDLERAGRSLELRYATGSEVFAPLGAPEAIEHPVQGEVIYVAAESGEVMCRRWNWRNGHTTRITEETRHMVMNIDGLGEGGEERAVAGRDGVAAMLQEFCGARVTTSLLTPSMPAFRFEV